MTNKTAIVWFRRDLRLSDNPAFKYALIVIITSTHYLSLILKMTKKWMVGDAAKWWLCKSLTSGILACPEI